MIFFFFSSRRRHTRSLRDWSSDVCSSDLVTSLVVAPLMLPVGFLLGYPPEVIALLGIGAMYLFFQGFLAALDATFRARRVLVFPALLLALQAVVTAAAGAVL